MADELQDDVTNPDADPNEQQQQQAPDAQEVDLQSGDPTPLEQHDQPGQQSVATPLRDLAQQRGMDVSSYESDDALLADLMEARQRAETLQQMTPYVQDYLQHREGYQSYLQQQQQDQQQQQTPEEPTFWQAPEYNPAWLGMVKRDDGTGQIIPDFSAGGTPEIAQKVQAYIQHRSDQQERFWSDPFSYLQEFVDARAQTQAKELVSQELGRHAEEQEAREFISANRAWLLKHDDKGVVMGNGGQPQLSEEGAYFMQQLEVGTQQYQMAPQAAKAYAMQMLQAARAQQAAAAGGDAQEQVNFLQKQAGFNPDRAASMDRKPDASGNVPPQDSTLSLAEAMRRNLEAAGVTDDDIAGKY
jgi:hypothetical protein